MTSELASALDRENVSSQNTISVLAAANIVTFYFSYSTIRWHRIICRETIAEYMKYEFKIEDRCTVF